VIFTKVSSPVDFSWAVCMNLQDQTSVNGTGRNVSSLKSYQRVLQPVVGLNEA